MDRSIVLWSLVVFFGTFLGFDAVSDLLADEPVALRLLAQLGLAVVVVGVIVVVMRRRERRG